VTPPAPARGGPDHYDKAIEGLSVGQLLSAINQTCYVVRVKVHCFLGERKLPDADITVEGVPVDKAQVSLPTSRLVPKSWHDRLVPFKSQVTRLIGRLTTTVDDGIYCVPLTKAGELFNGLEEIQTEYQRVARQLAGDWANILERARQQWPAATWSKLSRRLPTPEELPHRYRIVRIVLPLGGSGGISMGNRLPAGLDAATAAAVERESRELLEGAVQNMLREPIEEFNAAVDHILHLRQEEKICRQGTVDAIRNAIAKLQSFRHMVPDDVFARLNQIAPAMTHLTPTTVNSGAARPLTDALKQIREELGSEAALERGFRQMARVIEL
jgi:hypothetical protein